MPAETTTLRSSHKGDLTPPAGFKFNEELLTDYDEQVEAAIAVAEYQDAPLPSFEGVPTATVIPRFNPTGAKAEEVYAHDRTPVQFRERDYIPRSERSSANEPVTMWRLVERAKVEDGTGLVSSRILGQNSLGDVENFEPITHLWSVDQTRKEDSESTTPFVSFSTDPQQLANTIFKYGFGVKGGRDSVVVQVKVDPGRVLSGVLQKDPEVLLLGGVAPEEYVAAYELDDFIRAAASEGSFTTAQGEVVDRNRALGFWATRE